MQRTIQTGARLRSFENDPPSVVFLEPISLTGVDESQVKVDRIPVPDAALFSQMLRKAPLGTKMGFTIEVNLEEEKTTYKIIDFYDLDHRAI